MRINRAARPKTLATEFRPRGGERLVGAGGEINASSKQDLLHQIKNLVDGVRSGEVARKETEALSSDERRSVIAERQAILEDAINDKTGEKWLALGETVTEEIYEALGREGFTRKLLGFKPIKRGDIARIAVRKKDVLAYYIAHSSPTVVASYVRQNYVTPPDAYLLANIRIDNLELELADTDLLEHKYNDGLEQILRQEDLRTKALFDAAATAYNDLVYFNAFTPSVFQSMRTQIARWTIPCQHALIAIDLYNDILTDDHFASYYDPVSKHQLIMEGVLGNFFGVTLMTDGFRYETLQVLNPGEVYFLGTPKALGVVMERKPLTVENTLGAPLGQSWRGWYMEQIESQIVVNARACVRGQRT
jgi:hypothetical protein